MAARKTGYQITPGFVKVVDGGPHNGEPADVNNNLVAHSGLAQATMANPSDSPTYRVLNTDCKEPTTFIPIPIAFQPYFTLVADQVYTETMSEAPAPLNTPFFNYFLKNSVTGHYAFMLYFKWNSSSGPGPSVYYTADAITGSPLGGLGNAAIARITDPTLYPTADIPLSGVGRGGATLAGKVDTNGYIWITNSQSTAITSYWGTLDAVMRLTQITNISEFATLPIKQD